MFTARIATLNDVASVTWTHVQRPSIPPTKPTPSNPWRHLPYPTDEQCRPLHAAPQGYSAALAPNASRPAASHFHIEHLALESLVV